MGFGDIISKEFFCIVNSSCDNYLISFTTNKGACDYEK